jgi:Mg-chelatase subunit ChlD
MRVRPFAIAVVTAVLLAHAACGGHASSLLTSGDRASSGGSSGTGDGDASTGNSTGDDGSSSFVGDPDAQAPNAPGSTCAHVNVDIRRSVPDVWLMIDGSGSMGAPLQNADSRYAVLRQALVDAASGLVPQLQDSIAFGLYVYDGCAYDPSIVGPGCVAGACPRSVTVDPALRNFSAIAARYPQQPPGSSTPTDVALSALAAHIGANASSATPGAPSYVVLATDGEPNLCDWHDGVPSNPGFQQNALMAVQSMAASGTKVFAVSLAGGDAALEAYLDQLAAAGGTGQKAFTPASEADLVTALQSILGGAVSCDVTLTGTVTTGRECTGTVTLDGKAIACDDPNGWHLKDSRTIELAGASCDALRKQPSSALSATFPCDAYAPPK